VVSQVILIAIMIGVFFAGLGIGFAVLQSYNHPDFVTMTPQQMQQMMGNPQLMAQWHQTMMTNPQAMNQWMNTMSNNPNLMNQWMGKVMDDPQLRQQMYGMMFQNRQFMQNMMNNTQFQNQWMNPDVMGKNMMGSNMMDSSMMDSSMMDSSMMERGNVAMGFDQTKIKHNFVATSTGGEITISALDANDVATISEIRSHVEDIQNEFTQGNFEKPFFIHAQVVPGTQVMTAKKDLIQYSTRQIDGGAVLILTTSEPELLDAIKQFMDFQSTQHMGH
jgi:hypothetical protein